MKHLLALISSCTLTLQVYCLDVELGMVIPSFCGAATGQLHVGVSGGTPPYAISWSNGATTEMITDLLPGTYTLTVIDAALEEVMESFEVPLAMSYTEFYGPSVGPPQLPGWCVGDMPYAYPYAAYPTGTSGYPVGPGPWSFNVNGVPTAVQPNPCFFSNGYPEYFLPLDHPVGSTVSVTYTDGNGCSGSVPVTISLPVPDLPMPVLSTSGSCNGLSTGSVVVSVPPWSQSPGFTTSGLGLIVRPAGGLPISTCASGIPEQGITSGGLRTFTGLAPGDYELVIKPIDTDPQYVQSDLTACPFVSFTIPDLGTDCGSVTGRAFMDYNLNCTRQTNEPYVPGGIVEIQPGPVYAIMDAQGLYTVALPPGSYTLEQQSDILGEHCTGGPIPFTIAPGQTSTVHLPDTSAVPLDVRVMLSSGIARPGFEFQYSINVRNLTPSASGATTLTFTFDPTLGYLSASPNPSNITGNTLTWNQTQLAAWGQRSYSVRFQVPPDVGLLGYELVATADIATANTDGNLTNNTAVNYRTITGAYDPNDKLAYTSMGNTSEWQINEDEWIDYTIRFQNTGTDTAFNVLITDTLPPNLDPGTLIVGAASHTFTWELRDQGTLKFYFPNILLPDSNINEPRSHGFVGFRIRPRLPLLPGDEIENIANIYFDFNPPVITEPSVLVATTGTGLAQIGQGSLWLMPNPTDGVLMVLVDELGSSGGHLRVMGMDGRVVLEQRMSGPRTQLDVHDLAAGTYTLELIDAVGGLRVQRFVRQ